MKNTIYEQVVENGKSTIQTHRSVTHQQGSWKWQVRLCTATYRARQDHKGNWRWYSIGHGPSWSGGNIRNPHTSAQGSIHRKLLEPMALYALQTIQELAK